MSATTIPDVTGLFADVLRPGSRPDPYPLYEQLSRHPVSLLADGTYVLTRYDDITMLLRDPRISADRKIEDTPKARTMVRGADGKPVARQILSQDPPVHDTLRRQIMREFAPRITGLRGHIETLVTGLLDRHAGDGGPGQLDVVTDLAYPLPVTVICELMGVPREDEPVFSEFARKLTRGLDPAESLSEAELDELLDTRLQLRDYMIALVKDRMAHPGDDLVSALLRGGGGDGAMTLPDLISNLGLLLIAGHETTVNLITNGMLTLLRYPEAVERLRREPALMPLAVEELLRFEPPVQLLPQRTALTDVEIAGVTILKGAPLVLVLAAGSRDPERFPDPDRFDPARRDNQHFGFGSGVHICFGAPLARIEAQIALAELIRRLENPRLVQDPPPYRRSPILRGPQHLVVEIAGVGG